MMPPPPPEQPQRYELYSPYGPQSYPNDPGGPSEGKYLPYPPDDPTQAGMAQQAPPPPEGPYAHYAQPPYGQSLYPPAAQWQPQPSRSAHASWIRRHAGLSALIAVLLVLAAGGAFFLGMFYSLGEHVVVQPPAPRQGSNLTTPSPQASAIPTQAATVQTSAATAPVSTATPNVQRQSTVLGAPESAFIKRYGPPADDHSALDAYLDEKDALEIDAGYDPFIVSNAQAPAPNALVNSIFLSLQAGRTWSAAVGKAICTSFLPGDAHYVQDVPSHWQKEGLGIMQMYYSPSLGKLFPPQEFVDSDANPMKPGTIFLTYSYTNPNDGSSFVGCDMGTGQLHL
jgi:hypothetical protein